MSMKSCSVHVIYDDRFGLFQELVSQLCHNCHVITLNKTYRSIDWPLDNIVFYVKDSGAF